VAQRLFIGNLPYTADQTKLQEIFSQAGTVVSAQVITDRMTGRSRGFAFVEMSSDEETQKAVDTLNGFEIDGRKLIVNIARPREERPQGGGGGFGGGSRGGGYGSRRDDRG